MALYFFGYQGHARSHDWFESAWLSVCLGVFILYVIKYITNTIKKESNFTKKSILKNHWLVLSLPCFYLLDGLQY